MEPPIASPWGEMPTEPEEPEHEWVIPQLTEEQRARIRDTDYGRDCGWIVELDGEPIMLFSDCVYVEMFWNGYNVTLLTQDESILERLKSIDFFEPGVTFRNREFPDVPLPWHPMVHLLDGKGPAIVRGLYFVIDPPTPPTPPSLWQRLMKWLGYTSS